MKERDIFITVLFFFVSFVGGLVFGIMGTEYQYEVILLEQNVSFQEERDALLSNLSTERGKAVSAEGKLEYLERVTNTSVIVTRLNPVFVGVDRNGDSRYLVGLAYHTSAIPESFFENITITANEVG